MLIFQNVLQPPPPRDTKRDFPSSLFLAPTPPISIDQAMTVWGHARGRGMLPGSVWQLVWTREPTRGLRPFLVLLRAPRPPGAGLALGAHTAEQTEHTPFARELCEFSPKHDPKRLVMTEQGALVWGRPVRSGHSREL